LYILGISCFYSDASAALMKDGRVIAAAHEERFTRQKHDSGFPRHAIQYCLSEANIASRDLNYVGFYAKPLLRFERILMAYLATYPWSIASFLKTIPAWLKVRLWTPQLIRDELDYGGPIVFAEHHISLAAGAFLASPFQEAAILTLDGAGEWDTATTGVGAGNEIQLLKSLTFPHSLGLLYSAFTHYLGFEINNAENKVMELAPYGKPLYADLILKELVSLKDDGSFHLKLRSFAYDCGLHAVNQRFRGLFGAAAREPETPLTQFHKDIAASIQKVADDVMIRMVAHARKETGMKNLCLAGAAMLRRASYNKAYSAAGFHDIFIQPADGSAGALGVAYYIYNVLLHCERAFSHEHNFLGPSFSDEKIEQRLKKMNIIYHRHERQQLLKQTASLLADQNIIGWFQGRMEYGDYALGARSILADARNPENSSRMNQKIKFRESFRPFASTVLAEKTQDYFVYDRLSPNALSLVCVKKDKRTIPSVTHTDGSACVQSLRRDDHPLFYDLIVEFERLTGCPILMNASFNVRGGPIACTPTDAIRYFLRTDLDYLVIGSYISSKKEIIDSHQKIPIDDTVELDEYPREPSVCAGKSSSHDQDQLQAAI
jgi:carbamoyltransferase